MKRPLAAFAVLALLVTACAGRAIDNLGSSSGGSSSGGSSSGSLGDGGRRDGQVPSREPKDHRPAHLDCPGAAPAPGGVGGTGTGGAGAPCPPSDPSLDKCKSDGECRGGSNGHCVDQCGAGRQCIYDQCQADSDCKGRVCACAGSVGSSSSVNICHGDGNCQVDADCGPNNYCSPSYGGCGNFGGKQFFCHAAGDECIDDADCASGSDCRYQPAVGHWKCDTQHCAG